MYIPFKDIRSDGNMESGHLPRDTERGAQFKRMNILESEKQ